MEPKRPTAKSHAHSVLTPAFQAIPNPTNGVKRKRDDRFERTATNASSPPRKPDTAQNLSRSQGNGQLQNGKQDPAHRSTDNSLSKPLNEKRKALLSARKALPIWPHASEIRESLRGVRDVMLLVGETGSGKSTQVPQFLMNETWCQGCIAITQPRRVAAISLARRVAEEMGTPLGSSSPASKVGYSVRFDTSTSPSTRIKFLTEGMLLQEMLRDPWLRQYSAVIVDEVHERSVNVDLVLGFLRGIVTGDKKGRRGAPLKVAVMSATADIEGLFNFFDEGYAAAGKIKSQIFTPGPRADGEDDSESSWSGLSSPEETKGKTKGSGDQTVHIKSTFISTCYIEGRQFPVQIMYLPEPLQDFVETALRTIFQIHYKEPMPGDLLVFLTGQDTVEALEKLVNEYAQTMGPEVPKILTLPLFAALPQSAQQRVFQRAPPKTRKVILATNIAETSVTVPGVRIVVDSGKAKIKQFRNRLGLDSLLVKPISKSAAIQRKGRAGREAAGQCYRLYTEQDYIKLETDTVPEILRCDLSAAVLTMKARGVDDVVGFPFLTKPGREGLEKALLQLLQLGALNEDGKISETGRRISRLPLTPALGRVIVAAADEEIGCLSEVIDIISCLSVVNIFLNLNTEDTKEQAEAARQELYRRQGDHLTLLATVQAYAAERSDRRAWAEKYFVSHRAMQNVMDVRKQLRAQCQQQKLLPATASFDDHNTTTSEARTIKILKCFLRGFASNTARLMPDGSYKTLVGNQTVAIHPSSVLFGKKVEGIMYNEFVFTNHSYARNVSAVQMDWVGEVFVP
ncbi:P-loop containing nucleoside triphosphate hydrolase protein [Cryomyces antarcticus]